MMIQKEERFQCINGYFLLRHNPVGIQTAHIGITRLVLCYDLFHVYSSFMCFIKEFLRRIVLAIEKGVLFVIRPTTEKAVGRSVPVGRLFLPSDR